MDFVVALVHVGIDAVEKDMLLILDTMSITQVTGGRVNLVQSLQGEGLSLIPCCCLKT